MFCCVFNVVFFLLGDSLASEFGVPMFRNALSHLHRWCQLTLPMKMEQNILKCRYIKFNTRQSPKRKNRTNKWMLEHLCYYIGLIVMEDINNCVVLLNPLVISHSPYIYMHTQCVHLRTWLVVAFTISFLFQLQSHCNSSRCSVINFELSFFPSHVEEERLRAFRPLIIQVTFKSVQCPVQQLHMGP
jgi:hypothetical protein